MVNCSHLNNLIAGCGGGGNGISTANNLTQTQAQQLGSAVSSDVSKALASALGNAAVPLDITTRNNMLVALHRNNSQADTVSPEQVTCNGTTCTVSGTYMCPDGGSIGVSGDFSGSSMSATGTITETPTNCSDGTLVITGNLMAVVNGSNDGVTTTVNVTISGEVSVSPVQAGQFPTASCSIMGVTANVSVNDSSGSVTSSSISGSICGKTIN